MTVASEPRLVLVGRYRLDAPLGQRSDGWFCRAHDLVLDRPVMVKMFKSMVSEAAARTFAVQAKSLTDVRHEHLVALHDGGIADGHPYLVLEPVDGLDLLDDASERPLSAVETATLGAGLADALARMHEKGIVHGNLTPASVLIDADGQRRLVGFGFGHAHDGTAPGDVHALGLVLVQCLSEQSSGRLNGTIPSPLARVLTAMTCGDPAERPTAEVCARRLRQAADTLKSGRWAPTSASVPRDLVTGLAAFGGLVTVAAIAFAPTYMPHQAAPPMAAPPPAVASQFPLPDPTATTAPRQPVSHPPTTTTSRSPTVSVRPPTIAHPTVSAPPTTTTQPPIASADPTTVAPTTTDDVPPGLEKKPFGLPPGLLKKLFGLDPDGWGWQFDW